MESNIANFTKTNNFQEKITAQEHDKVFLYPDSSEYQGNNLGEEVRPLSKELRPVNTEIDITVAEVVREDEEVMSTDKYN